MEIGIWENVKETENRAKDGHSLYSANCKFCGMERIATLSNLKQAKKCHHIKTGIKNRRILSIYTSMKRRCYNKDAKEYKFYGGKGINICDEWLYYPKSFEIWAIENGYKENLTIDRKDSEKNYCPENCRWITGEDNARYKSSTILIKANGEEKTGKQWGKEIGAGVNIINNYRRKYGKEKTAKFIEYVLKNGLPEIKRNESYMSKFIKDSM